jgi:hypothetical protein
VRIIAERVEDVVVDAVLTWHGNIAWADEDEVDRPVDAARRQLDHAQARLDAILADDRLREAAGDDAYYAQVRQRREAVDRARAELEEAEAQEVVDEQRWRVLVSEWGSFDHATRAYTIRAVIDSVYVRRGRGRDPRERVLIRWAGEDRFERPTRGMCKYVTRPIPWPEFGLAPRAGMSAEATDLALANVPEWAWRMGHPNLPVESRDLMHEVAREVNLPWYLPGERVEPVTEG